MNRMFWILFRSTLVLCLTVEAYSQSLPWAASVPLKELTGLRVPRGWARLGKWKKSSDFGVRVADLPEFYDWRFYAQGLPPVKRQRYNDCWAQGTVGVLESLIKIHLGKEENISVQEVISCSGKGTAARGGFFAHSYHQAKGAVEEGQFPYQARDVRCKAGLKPQYRLKAWGYVGSQGKRPSVSEIKQAIMEHGPVGTTITANSALQRFSGGGVFSGCASGRTNHIEVIVGWNDKEGSKGVWFVRNSWGESHGEKGYAKIPYGCSNVGEIVTWADLEMP